jgi:hypothetical protein
VVIKGKLYSQVADNSSWFMDLGISFENKISYLEVRARGMWKLEDVKEMMSLTRVKADANDQPRVLLDMRNVGNVKKQMDRLYSASHAVEVFGSDVKVAALGQSHSITKMTENFAVNRGVSLLITGDEDEALKWLLS